MKTKKGMASLYLVSFTTLLLSIVTMSFVSVMVSESREASNSDLSQSAFDSALAGIEDAKTAILMYEACSNPSAPVSIQTEQGTLMSCTEIKKVMTEGFKNNDCDTAKKILNGDPTAAGEVYISEDLNQAYTCVPISDDSPTYRSTLTENTRSRAIDAGNRITQNGVPKYAETKGIELQWYTPEAELGLNPDLTYMYDDGSGLALLGTKDMALESYPVLNFELFQTDEQFTMAELDVNNDNNTGTDHAMIMLYPDKNASIVNKESGTFVSKWDLLNASSKSNTAAQNNDRASSVVPKSVSCEATPGTGPRCRAIIEFPDPYKGGPRAQSTFMFRISLPYGAPGTDFSI